jgi:hypothetical protein
MNQKKETREEVFAACKRGSDPATSGQSCDSKRAYKLNIPNSGAAAFQCVKCNHSWAVPLGGSFKY